MPPLRTACPSCGGSGECPGCVELELNAECDVCRGSGVCLECGGDGEIEDEDAEGTE